MRLNSTGLGKTTLHANITDITFQHVEGEGDVIRVGMEAYEPVHWQMNARLDEADVLVAIKLLAKFLSNPLRCCRVFLWVVRGLVKKRYTLPLSDLATNKVIRR